MPLGPIQNQKHEGLMGQWFICKIVISLLNMECFCHSYPFLPWPTRNKLDLTSTSKIR